MKIRTIAMVGVGGCLAVLVGAGSALADYADFVNSLNPTVYYRLNETASGTVFDSSGNGNDAVHTGGTVNQANSAIAGDAALGTNGYAVNLTGIEASALVSGSQDFSISIWANPANFGGGDFGTFFYMGKNGGTGESLIIAEDGVGGNGLLRLGTFGGDFGPNGGAGFAQMQLNQWNHIGATYDSATQTYTQYLNGQQDFSTTVALNIGSGGSSLGSLGLGLGQNFDGLIDEFAFFRTVLSADDMANLANASVPEPTSLVLLAFGLLVTRRRSNRG